MTQIPYIVADIGGTYARFAVHEGKAFQHMRKYKAADFKGLEAALAHYQDEVGVKLSHMRVATAAYLTADDCWRFLNCNEWLIDPAALTKAGWTLSHIVNDFEAATLGLLGLSVEMRQILKAGDAQKESSRCLIGPGTGLGLGYLSAAGVVQKTHGGHMVVSTITDEQRVVIDSVQKAKAEPTIPVFENVVSGPGLFNIYRALCRIEDCVPEFTSVEGLIEHKESEVVQETIRLFHEFFGLFAHMAVVTGHAYGGLYLTGGVLDRLIAQDLFNIELFERWFILDGAPSVKDDCERTPIIYCADQHLSFKGLAQYE